MSETNIHDHVVRAILGDKEMAIDYFKSRLSQEIQQRLDFSTLLQLPDSYLSKQLRKTMSDIVYSCHCTDSSIARISLLIEHKSYYDPFTPVQLGCYIFSALQKQSENDRQLSMIIPILCTMVKGSLNTKHWQACLGRQIFSGKNSCQTLNMFFMTWELSPTTRL